MKLCGGCSVEKPVDDFYLIRGKPAFRCKDCQKEYRRQWKQRLLAEGRWAQVEANQRMRQRYGMSLEQYEARLFGQGYCCALCEEPFKLEATRKGGPYVDHDHATGQVRGIVCPRCNQLLGALDQVDLLEKAGRYLGRI